MGTGYENRRTMKHVFFTGAFSLAAAAMMAVPAFAIDQDIVILHTNDVHCGIEDNIGYSGLVSYKKQMEAETPYVTLVDAGDAIQGAPVGTLSEGGYIVDIMNAAGYDFAIPGNHEFDYGMDRFLGLSSQLDCGYYSCNFVNLPSYQNVFKPYKMISYDDVQVAYVGVTTPESITKSTPAYFQNANKVYKFGFHEDVTGEKLYARVQSTVDDAKAAGADYVVLVVHLGMDGVTDTYSSGALIANTTGVDLVIDGHSHQSFTQYCPNENGAMVPVAQTGTKFKNIGKITITPAGEIKMELVDSVASKDEGMDAVINGIKAQYEESLKTVLGHTAVKLTDKNPETGMRAVRNSETNLGDFCADAYRYMMGAEIGLMNGGGIRAGIEAGEITYEDALTVYPYGNMICMKNVPGSVLRDALEMGVRLYPKESGAFIHVSGMTYTVDSSVPSGVQLDEKGNFAGVSGGRRVKDIMVNGEPLDDGRMYTVASHNYWLKSGGDGMSMFADCELLKDEVMVDVDSITSYIAEYLGGSVGEEYADPMGQGRITIQ